MVIRDFEAKDFERIIEIDKLSYETPTPKQFVLDSILGGKAWVAVEDDQIIGFIIGKVKHGTPYVNNVCLAPDHRGKGYAKLLFGKFEEVFGMNKNLEDRVYWLQVDSSNPAQKLYFDLGYRVGWIDQNYYGWSKHALCMYKSARPIVDFTR